MLRQITKHVQRRVFNWQCRAAPHTAPINPIGASPIIVSMVCKRDLTMYLLAIKSFYHWLGRGQVVIINDGTLSDRDLALIKGHVRPLAIYDAAKLASPKCPKYISWKKLFCIAECIQDEYTIQLDSDTLTLSDIPEIAEYVDSNTSFILGTKTGVALQPIDLAINAARKSTSEHVQISAERHFDQLPGYPNLKYVRGCSGFDGFGKGAFDLKFLEEFSAVMYAAIGGKWNEWGSEQTTSNYIIANAGNSAVLPFPRYYSYWGKTEPAAFAHFIGAYRYQGGVYSRQARECLQRLMPGASNSEA